MTTLRRFFASSLLALSLMFGYGAVAPAAAENAAPVAAAVQDRVEEIWIIVIETEDEIIIIIIIFEVADEAVA